MTPPASSLAEQLQALPVWIPNKGMYPDSIAWVRLSDVLALLAAQPEPTQAVEAIRCLETMANSEDAIGYSFEGSSPDTARECRWRAQMLHRGVEALRSSGLTPTPSAQPDLYEELRAAIDPRHKLQDHKALVALAQAQQQDSEDVDLLAAQPEPTHTCPHCGADPTKSREQLLDDMAEMLRKEPLDSRVESDVETAYWPDLGQNVKGSAPTPSAWQPGPPGRWICRTCGFQLTKAFLRAEDGAVGVDARPVYDVCPNDGSSMQPITWEEDAADANRVGLEQMKRADRFEKALQSIANSACCTGCKEAALVAKAALRVSPPADADKEP